MLKAIQNLGSVAYYYRLKPPHAAKTNAFVSTSAKPLPCSSPITRPTNPFMFLTRKTRSLGPVRAHSTPSESKMDGTSSSSVAVQSSVSFSEFFFTSCLNPDTLIELVDKLDNYWDSWLSFFLDYALKVRLLHLFLLVCLQCSGIRLCFVCFYLW